MGYRPTYYSFITRPQCLASDDWIQSSIGILAAPVDPDIHTGRRGAPKPAHVGTAVVAGRTCVAEPETVWRLVVRGESQPGAYLLRGGEFIELGDAAEWRGWGGTANAVEAACQSWRWARPFDDPSLAETY